MRSSLKREEYYFKKGKVVLEQWEMKMKRGIRLSSKKRNHGKGDYEREKMYQREAVSQKVISTEGNVVPARS